MDYQRKEIPGREGYYADTNGEIWSALWGKTECSLHKLRQDKLWFGHLRVRLVINGRRKDQRVHRLLGITFLPNPNNLPFVCHENGDPADNSLGNLYWGTQRENMRDRVRHGTHCRGERANTAKLDRSAVERIKLLKSICPSMSQKEIAKVYKVSQSTISSIQNGRNWTYEFMPGII